MTEPCESFGACLRHERERRGITLDAIAHETKVKRSLFASLERDDVSQWPAGIFRRAFLRGYARAIGLPPEPLVAEFVRLFPETNDGSGTTGFPLSEPEGLRLQLADDPPAFGPRVTRILTAVADAGAVIVLAILVAQFLGTTMLSATGAVALVYYTVPAACWGRSVVAWCVTSPSSSPLPSTRLSWRLPESGADPASVASGRPHFSTP